LQKPKWFSEAVIRRMTDNTMALNDQKKETNKDKQ
jgi:hypothetical protein